MTRPLVSVVLPTFNGARFIREAIDSLVVQTYTHWELVLVDDASTDGTPEILAGYARADPRITVVRNERNLRLPQSLNKGFSLSRGALLTWTSDDNLYRPSALEIMVGALEARPDVGMVYTDYTDIAEDGSPIRPVLTKDARYLTCGNCIVGSFMYRREVMETIGGYDHRAELVEDWDYWIRVAKSFVLLRLPSDVYLYRCHPSSLSSTRQADVSRAYEQLMNRHLRDPRLFDGQARAEGLLALMRKANDESRAVDARRYYRAACRQDFRFVLRNGRALLIAGLLGQRPAQLADNAYRMMRRLARAGSPSEH